MRVNVRLGNTVLLLALLSAYTLPPGTIQRAVAQSPPHQPTSGPLAGNFIDTTMATMHLRLFGQVPTDEQTAFYHTTEVIDGMGSYDAVNNLNEPCTLEVIRFTGYEHVPDGSCGMIWGKVSTSLATLSFVGLAMAWDHIDADPLGNTLGPAQGFMPLMLHAPLQRAYIQGDPSTPIDDFAFDMLAEDWDPQSYYEELAAQDDGPQLCLQMQCPEGQVLWCPGNDPTVIAAREALQDCLIDVSLALAAALAAVASTLYLGTKLCLAGGANPVALFLCLSVVNAIVMAELALALIAYGIAAAACMATYLAAYLDAKSAACGGAS